MQWLVFELYSWKRYLQAFARLVGFDCFLLVCLHLILRWCCVLGILFCVLVLISWVECLRCLLYSWVCEHVSLW